LDNMLREGWQKHRRSMCIMLRRVVQHIGHFYDLCLSYSSWKLSMAGQTVVSMIYCISLHGYYQSQT
jgi:hypothetical protein